MTVIIMLNLLTTRTNSTMRDPSSFHRLTIKERKCNVNPIHPPLTNINASTNDSFTINPPQRINPQSTHELTLTHTKLSLRGSHTTHTTPHPNPSLTNHHHRLTITRPPKHPPTTNEQSNNNHQNRPPRPNQNKSNSNES